MPKQQQIQKTGVKKYIFFVKLSYSSLLFIGPPGRVKHIKKVVLHPNIYSPKCFIYLL